MHSQPSRVDTLSLQNTHELNHHEGQDTPSVYRGHDDSSAVWFGLLRVLTTKQGTQSTILNLTPIFQPTTYTLHHLPLFSRFQLTHVETRHTYFLASGPLEPLILLHTRPPSRMYSVPPDLLSLTTTFMQKPGEPGFGFLQHCTHINQHTYKTCTSESTSPHIYSTTLHPPSITSNLPQFLSRPASLSKPPPSIFTYWTNSDPSPTGFCTSPPIVHSPMLTVNTPGPHCSPSHNLPSLYLLPWTSSTPSPPTSITKWHSQPSREDTHSLQGNPQVKQLRGERHAIHLSRI